MTKKKDEGFDFNNSESVPLLKVYSVNAFESLIKKTIQEVLGQMGLESNSVKPSEYLTIKQASLFLHKAVPTLYKMVEKREIAHIKKNGKIYFQKEILEEWLLSGLKPSQSRNN